MPGDAPESRVVVFARILTSDMQRPQLFADVGCLLKLSNSPSKRVLNFSYCLKGRKHPRPWSQLRAHYLPSTLHAFVMCEAPSIRVPALPHKPLELPYLLAGGGSWVTQHLGSTNFGNVFLGKLCVGPPK
jgi:hypothetical protein